ncbi:fimbrillin family protein [uncultured Bacteroides sp.]|uniref:fimbrillin family protein n=1 Tax=uncultured Bacteroides sp. TaxID=162156 RepID=UPI0026157E2B|nr:fimbrillin family protein [uncultured Bacteroides sp.]
MKTKALLFAAIATALVACDNNNQPAEQPVAAVINATISDVPLTRASGTVWAPNDQIGITATSQGRTQYTNIAYFYQDKKFLPQGGTIYFQDDAEVTFRAYYPYCGTAGTDPGVINVETGAATQTAALQPGIDFLYAGGATASKFQPEVKFRFAHCMSQITLTFIEGDDISFATLEGYTLDNLKPTGTFDTATGTATATATQAEPLTIDLTASAEAGKQCISRLIVLPQPAPDGLPIHIVVDGETYQATLNIDSNELKPGNNYVFNITVNKTDIDVQSADIQPWNDIPANDVDAQM